MKILDYIILLIITILTITCFVLSSKIPSLSLLGIGGIVVIFIYLWYKLECKLNDNCNINSLFDDNI